LKTTKEEYIQSVYRVIDYIERHYNEELRLDTLCQIAGFSKYHFHRIFGSIAGENIAEYIRRVRLQSTTVKFKMDINITQIAMQSGYETNASFSKAFKKHFGITPKEFAKRVKNIKEEKMLQPNYIEIEPVEVLYVRKTGSYAESTKQAWESILEFAAKQELFGKVAVRYGIAYDNPDCTQEEKLRYEACVCLKEGYEATPHGEVCKKTIEGGRYAVFLHRGSYMSLDVTYKQIGDWMVQSGVTLRDRPVFQKYLDLDPREVDENDLQTEVYVPVK
jgi:AraC family transcriptional regulator